MNMKNTYLLSVILLLTSICGLSQKSISYVSSDRDTLFLPDNNTGQLVLTSWDNVPKKDRPVIIFVSEESIAQMQARKEDE